jgi:uncharacterized protein YdgA (DUF945 family)
MAIGTALLAATAVAFTPTSASAFDIQGLIGTAMALQMGAYHRSPYHQTRGQITSRHDGNTNGNNSGVERDARDVDVSNHTGKSETKVTVNQTAGTSQASERDASADQGAPSSRRYNDEPVYSPSR